MRLFCLMSVLLVACDVPRSSSGTQEETLPLDWEAVEVVRIGALDGPAEYTLNQVRDLAQDDEGALYVLDQGNRLVRRYDSRGQHELTFGGAGEGPGEFSAPLHLAVAGDSVVVFDPVHQRLTYFSRSGEVIQTVPVEISPLTYGIPQGLFPVAGRWLLVLATGCRFPRPEDSRPRWRLAVVEESGSFSIIADELARDRLAVYGDPGCASMPALARPATSIAVDSDGLMYWGDGERYEIEVLDLAVGDGSEMGRPIRVIGREARPLEVSPGRVQAYEREFMESDQLQADASLASRVRAVWDSMGYPEHWPFFEELHVDHGDRLWVGRPIADPDAPREWDLFSREGEYLGTVELPSDLEVMVITGERVWGLVKDDFDVQYVVGLEVRG